MKVKKKSKGITLISLVITVVVMLILAGVTISVFTGTDGMFSSITQATREYKKQAMLEAVDLAKAYVELDKTYTNEPITITDVIDKIKEVSTINEKDYIITVDDEEQTATIIDKATGVVVDVWIDENGHIQSDGNIVDDVENLVKPTVTYELDPPAGTNTDEVKITITATEEKNGIVRMVLPDNSEIIYNKEKEVTKEYIVTENGTYTFVVEGANGRKTTKYVEVQNITSVANIVMEVQNTEPTNQAVNVLITYDENVKMGGQVLVNADRFQYSIGGNNWQNASSANTTIQVGVNGTVYARYYSGTEGFGTTSVTIQNIDKIGPNTFDLSTTKTTNSITVSGSTEDTGTTGCAIANIGVRGYQYKLSSSTGEIITNWTTETTATSYTFNDLTQGTTYKVSMRAVDKAGNITEATNKDESVTLSTTPDSSTAIGITYNPTTPTTGNVQVTFTNNSGQSGLTLKYQIGSQTGTWITYTGPVTMTTNGKVYARLFDANNQYTNTATATVQNIDRIAPNVFNLSTTKTTNSITVSGSTEDTGTTGCATENYGIRGYQFQLKDSAGSVITSWTTETTATSYTFNDLTQGTTYKVSMRAIDKAGNITEATNKDESVTLSTTPDSSTAIGITYNPTIPTTGNVQVTFTNNSGQSGLTLKYQIGSQTGTWTTYTVPVTMTTNGKVYARLFDANNQYTNTATATVQNIDRIAPNVFNLSTTKTTNSITVSGKTEDTGSAGCAIANIGVRGYQYKLSSSTGEIITNWTTEITATSYTFNDLTQGTTYKVSMRAIDKAGNITEATNKDESVTLSTTPDSSTAIGIAYNPTIPTTGNVQVTFTNNSGQSGLTLKYQIGSQTGTWNTYTGPVTMTTNGKVYARLFDSTGQSTNTATGTIQNIDRIAPNVFNLSTTKTTNSITVSGKTEDTGSAGCAIANIGVRGYQYKLSSSTGEIITNWTTETTATSYTFNNLTQGTTYKVSMRAIDKAGNITEASNKDTSVTLSTTPDSSTAIGITYNPTIPTTGNVQVTFTNNSGQSGLTLKYQIGSQTGTWTTYTGPVTMTANGKVYARLFDNKEQYTNTATATVANIDKVVPVISSATASTRWGATNTVTVKATDAGTAGCAAGNIGIVGYGINQSSTTEPTYTPCAATTSLSTTINNITANGTYHVWVKDQAGNTANKEVTVSKVDTTAPTTATIASSNVEAETFTLIATGADGESGISKYEFYINNTLEKTVTTTAGSATYNVTGKTGSTNYTCYVKVYDAVGKSKQSSSITVTTKSAGTPIAQVVQVGHYVNYDAGTWTEADFNKITSSTGSPTVNKSTSLPSTQGQFGGFTVGQSRNTNSTEYNSSYKPRTAGWRVWSIDRSTGVVTLISAGHPETYYHAYRESTASVNILRNRDCSMYENSYAQAGSAHILTGQEAAEWYNTQFGTDYEIIENGGSNSTFYNKTFTTAEPISVLENGSYYWFASAYSSSFLYFVSPGSRRVNYDYNFGVRCAPPSFSTIWSPSRTRQWRRKRRQSMEINAIIKA